TSLEERDKAIAAQWHRRIERARYDADLAERRYESVDPSNRLIASTLEQRWNDAMRRLLELQAELAKFESQQLRTVTADQSGKSCSSPETSLDCGPLQPPQRAIASASFAC